ncbi:hypothetical protein [Phormidium tenue]|uniref:Uncharacterized protein n=2 Tax=Phormidium tenue TaxID=126344 RepID=A0A1U7J2M6_9CYAN|nr:hypothetical protein [Phormidium tenue]MBD2231881.1 hypothetical protein [Phormidium tenue FACHB-1052]OKH46438.1 hypothetical protein NIES30_17240 [Phormidium tenue NIES-30]
MDFAGCNPHRKKFLWERLIVNLLDTAVPLALFSTRQEAEQALHQLRDSGFHVGRVSAVAKSGEGLSVLTPDRDFDPDKTKPERAQDGAGAGAMAGAAVNNSCAHDRSVS